MIPIENYTLYQSIMSELKTSSSIEKLSSLHSDFAKLIFSNFECKKMYNKNLSFLHLLCKTRNKELFIQLNQKNPEIFEELINRSNDVGWTPIYFAIKKNDIDFVKELLNCKATLKPAKFASPLILACQKGDKILIDLILSKSDEETLQYQDVDGITALLMAIYVQKIEIVDLLIEKYGLKTRVFDKKGASALHWACSSENLGIFKVLLEKGGLKDLINHQDNDGNTPLHSLAENCDQIEVFREVLLLGADPFLKNNDGFTPEEFARECENFLGEEILQSLTRKSTSSQNSWCRLL